MPLQWIGAFSVRCNNPVVTERVDASIRSLIPSNILITGLIYLVCWVSDGAQTFISVFFTHLPAANKPTLNSGDRYVRWIALCSQSLKSTSVTFCCIVLFLSGRNISLICLAFLLLPQRILLASYGYCFKDAPSRICVSKICTTQDQGPDRFPAAPVIGRGRNFYARG